MTPLLRMVLVILCVTISISHAFSQQENTNQWSIGAGVTNFIMFGDLTSDKPNLGHYLYLNKMITPVFGLEIKGQILDMQGNSQDFSSVYPVLYTNSNTDNLRFEGDTFGGELNLVFNINNMFFNKEQKIDLSTYFGIGYHAYSTKLFDANTDELLLDYSQFNSVRGSEARSVYYTSALGLKYKLSDRLDLELRQSINFNNEDHLDATISKKQELEIFFTTQLGLVINLHKRNAPKENASVEGNNSDVINLNDSDGDGVIDQFDKEPNTEKGALVYANGVTIDSDKDGVPDHLDKCPLKYGKGLYGCDETSNSEETKKNNDIESGEIEEVPDPTKEKVIIESNEEKVTEKKVDEEVISETIKEEIVEPVEKIIEEEAVTETVEEPITSPKEDIVEPIEKVVNEEFVTETKKEKAVPEPIKEIKQPTKKEEKLSPAYEKEKALIESIIARARNKAKKIAENESNREEIIDEIGSGHIAPVNQINKEAIAALNEDNIKHNIAALDNSVNIADIHESPVYPGCEDQLTKLDKENCMVTKISLYSLYNFNPSSYSNPNITKGTNLMRIILVINEQGKSKVFKLVGDWDNEVKKEVQRVISSLPIMQPGKLNNIPTPVKLGLELPFKIE